MKKLLSSDIDINEPDRRYGETPLYMAVSRNKYAQVKLLLESGADPNARNCNEEQPLHTLHSFTNEDRKIAKLLVAHNANVNGSFPGNSQSKGGTVLTKIIQNDMFTPKLEALRFFLEHGANPKLEVENVPSLGELAVEMRFDYQYGGIACLLIQYGFSENIRGARGSLGEACEKAKKENRYKEDYGLDDRFLDAVQAGDIDEVDELLIKGADINVGSVEKNQSPALELALRLSTSNMVSFLLQKGANPNKEGLSGTPLTILLKRPRYGETTVTLTEILLEKGANPSISDSHSITPLSEARALERSGDEETKHIGEKVRLLLEKHGAVNPTGLLNYGGWWNDFVLKYSDDIRTFISFYSLQLLIPLVLLIFAPPQHGSKVLLVIGAAIVLLLTPPFLIQLINHKSDMIVMLHAILGLPIIVGIGIAFLVLSFFQRYRPAIRKVLLWYFILLIIVLAQCFILSTLPSGGGC